MTTSTQIVAGSASPTETSGKKGSYKDISVAIAQAWMTSTQAVISAGSPNLLIDSSMHRTQSEAPADRQLRRLYQMKLVGDGWAGVGSIAPSHESIDRAAELITRFRSLPFPIPMASVGADGQAGLSWSDSKVYADIEVLEDGKLGYLIQIKGGRIVDDEVEMPPVGLPRDVAAALTSAYLTNKK